MSRGRALSVQTLQNALKDVARERKAAAGSNSDDDNDDTTSKNKDNAKRRATKKKRQRAKKRANRENEESDGDDQGTSVVVLPPNPDAIAFEAGGKRLTYLPNSVLRDIISRSLPDEIMIHATKKEDEWKLTCDKDIKWVQKLMLLDRNMRSAARRAIADRAILHLWYEISGAAAIRIELDDETERPEIPTIAFPRYLVKWAKTLRVWQSQMIMMFRSYHLDVSEFRKLESLDMIAGDLAKSAETLVEIVHDNGSVRLYDQESGEEIESFDAYDKLASISTAYDMHGYDFADIVLGRAAEDRSHKGEMFKLVAFRDVYGAVMRETFDRELARYELLPALAEVVLGIRREGIGGLRNSTELRVVFQDLERDGREVCRCLVDLYGTDKIQVARLNIPAAGLHSLVVDEGAVADYI